MSTARRLAWLDGLAALAVLAAFTAWSPADTVTAPPWVVAARLGVVVAVCATAFYYNDLYDFEVPHDFAQLFTRLARALGLSALALAVTYVLYPPAIIGGNFVSMALPGLLVALLAVRGTVYVLARRPAFSERVVLLGGGALAAELAAHIHARPDLAARLVGVLAPSGAEGPGPRLGAYGDLQDVVRRYRPDRIIVALPDRRGHLPVADLLACRVRGIHIEEGTRAYERFMRRLAVETLAPSALVFGDGFRVTRIRLAVKRLLSVAVALAGLWVAAPLMAAIALAIKLESRGPVFFVQERVGLHGRPFRLVKFRTMREAVPAADGVWERDNASRVTRLGAVLRKYRLDELPQFINILRGDMSLVGPRPEMAGNIATFSAVIPFYNLRHEVRPGLTGWAQVKAGYSMSTEEVTRKLCYDLYYIKHLSLAFDLQILLDTVKFVLSGKRPG